MESRIGLAPEELIAIFNSMYLDVWERMQDQVEWQSGRVTEELAAGREVDLKPLLLELMEVVITAARDATVLTVYENNEKIVEDLKQAGIELPSQ